VISDAIGVRLGKTPTEVTVWDRGTDRPARTEQRDVHIEGIDTVEDAHQRAALAASIHRGLAAYPPSYRSPVVEVSPELAANMTNGDYDQTGIRIGTDRIRLSTRLGADPAHAEQIVRHENAHRVRQVLKGLVHAREGRDAGYDWLAALDRASLAWLADARRVAPDHPGLWYADATERLRSRGVHGTGDPADEAFADIVAYAASGQPLPGDVSGVVAVMMRADPNLVAVLGLSRVS